MRDKENLTLPVFGIERHRMNTDGVGVTTLVGTYGCPLQCKYCINPCAWDTQTLEKTKFFTTKELYDVVKIDNLYFQATGGGIVFGGGEPLLHADFYREFRKMCDSSWRLTVETSLNVSKRQLEKTFNAIDDYIVDIKDINSEIYCAYTGRENEQVLQNLELLLANKSADNICVRVPKISNYNTREDIAYSVKYLKEHGVKIIEEFSYIIPKQ